MISHFIKCPKSSITNCPPKVVMRPSCTLVRTMPATIKKKTDIQETVRVELSPRNTPSISNAIDEHASTISGRAGIRFGIPVTSILPSG